MDKRGKLVQYVKDGDTKNALTLVKELASEIDLKEMIGDLTKGMREVGESFEKSEIFLPEMMLASEALIEVMSVLKPLFKEKGEEEEKIKVVMATVKGDVHEIGKNIVSLVLKANGYEIVDLGRNVDPLNIIKGAESNNVKVIGLSALMTTTMPAQEELIKMLKDKGVRDKFKVVVGGAPVSSNWASEIGADGYAKDAFQAVCLIDSILKENGGE
ncbi:cobalamin-dependent protein [Candidatus Aerophobetes bacterium]|nr:cobalamin-dependent protein [Candidatus Aerophobetes bacterium]